MQVMPWSDFTQSKEEFAQQQADEQGALNDALGATILRAAATNFLVFERLRYGLYCSEPDRVLHPHQIVVCRDLMKIAEAKMLLADEDMDTIPLKYWLTAPRGFVKTSTLADFFIWRIGNDPTLRIKLVAQNSDRAVKQLGDMSRYMIHSPLFKAVFPDREIADNCNRTKFSVVRPPDTIDGRDATIEASGYNSSPEGSRCDIMWFDDVCTYANSVREEKERENIKEKLRASWWPIAEGPDTEMYWSCTLFHDEDASTMILKTPGWTKRFMRISRTFDVIEDVREEITYPLPAVRWNVSKRRFERWWNEDKLRELHDADPEAFRISHFLETVTASADRASFPREYFWGTDEEPGMVDFTPYGANPGGIFGCDLVVMGVDLAFGKKSTAANTALQIIGYRYEDQKRVMLGGDYGRGWATMDKLRHIAEQIALYNPDLIVIEDNAAQKMLVEFLQEMQVFDVPIESFTTDVTKNAKLTLLSREMKEGKWVIPFPDEPDLLVSSVREHGETMGCKCIRCNTIREAIGYPGARFSDCLMGLLFARHGLKILGVGAVTLSVDAWDFSF